MPNSEIFLFIVAIFVFVVFVFSVMAVDRWYIKKNAKEAIDKFKKRDNKDKFR